MQNCMWVVSQKYVKKLKSYRKNIYIKSMHSKKRCIIRIRIKESVCFIVCIIEKLFFYNSLYLYFFVKYIVRILHIILSYIIIALSSPLFHLCCENEKDLFISLQLLITHRILAFPSRKQDPNLLCIGNHILLGNHCDRLHCYQQLHQ